jgi:hypothetical protein
MRWQTQGIAKLRIVAISFVAKPLARNDRFSFQSTKTGSGTLVSFSRKLLSKLARLTKS